MRVILISWLSVLVLMVSCQQDLPLWSGQAISKELLRPYLLEPASSSSEDSSDYEAPKASYTTRQVANGLKKRVGESETTTDPSVISRGFDLYHTIPSDGFRFEGTLG
ncbi:uncharacterized protein CDAR_261411 [Caerostris darwini]|uniref:Uncharacterized protein n=1 Tax=Caerostris darwini TaxID=1538125 RepID=A0AAV4SVW4_9ARAC|nr:uncharacterized protein CDAR_261411 [Caerostris darwini]